MTSSLVKMSNLTNGEAGNSFPCKKGKGSRRSSNRRLGNMGSDVTNANSCCEKNGGEGKMEEMSCGDEADNLDEHMDPNLTSKRVRIQKEITMEDMLNTADDYGEEEDDSDWEPLQMQQLMAKWFCINCTMVNLEDVICCDMCGENKESAVFWHGFFESPFSQGVGITQAERHRDLSSQSSATTNSTAVGFDERMLLHSEAEMRSNPHPERPDRVRAIAASLASSGIFPGRCFPIPAREITKQELERVHSSEHVEDVNFTSRMYSSYFTPDTYANEHSACAARLAAGLCADLASAIFSGRVKNGFALVRPPGHHAGVSQAMGFCLHNNAAVAAVAAQAAGAKKILIVDWDVHHGNGTQEIFDSNKSVLYVSLHRHEGGNFYPGTGAADEVGSMGAEGYCVNVPWSQAGVGDNDYMFAFQHVVLPIASEFMPDFTIVSAGFDAARGDPLGCCDITPAGYAQMTHMLNAVSGGKLLVILEGGYNLRSISASAIAVIKELLGDRSECGLENCIPSGPGLTAVLEVLKIQMTFWPTLESSFTQLQAQWGSSSFENGKKEAKKRRRAELVWWKLGPRRLFYHVLYKRHLHRKPRRLR